jgi:hypothetical protein
MSLESLFEQQVVKVVVEIVNDAVREAVVVEW